MRRAHRLGRAALLAGVAGACAIGAGAWAVPALATPSPAPVDNSHQFAKPIKPPSGLNLTIDAQPKRVAAGGEALITVTVMLLDKPRGGEPVRLLMITSPGTDHAFVPESGVTDDTGAFQARVKVSSTPGDNIIMAQSGALSDQDLVVGTASAGAANSGFSTNPEGSTINPASSDASLPLLGLAALAAMLVAAGLYVNLRSRNSLG